MELTATQEVIRQLKTARAKRDLSMNDVVKMVEATGEPVSETAIRRVFKPGSEINDTFNYEHTIRPLAQALLTEEYQMEEQNDLNEQANRIIGVMEQRFSIFEDCLATLREQIEIKDQIIGKLLEVLDSKPHGKKAE